MSETAAMVAFRLRQMADTILDTNGADGMPDAAELVAMAVSLEARALQAGTVVMPEGWASEAVLTIVLTAAAKAAYEEQAAGNLEGVMPTWDALEPMVRYHMRTTLLAPVLATVEALPDLRREAWIEGAEATAEWMANNPSPAGVPTDPPSNPYPEPELRTF